MHSDASRGALLISAAVPQQLLSLGVCDSRKSTGSTIWVFAVQRRPAVPLSTVQQALLDGFRGTFLTLVLLPRRLSPEHVDAVAWLLLTFYAYLDMHVKSFKVILDNPLRLGNTPIVLYCTILSLYAVRLAVQ